MSRRVAHLLRSCLASPGCTSTSEALSQLQSPYLAFYASASTPKWQSSLGKIHGEHIRRFTSTTSPRYASDIPGLFQSLHGAEFQQHLKYLRQRAAVMPYTKLIQEFNDAVPSASPEDAAHVCQALASSGAVVRRGDLVYLRPEEVVAAFHRVLPADQETLATRLEESRIELEKLSQQKQSIESSAQFRARAANWAFFGALAAQWGLLFRLTYWELSWDIIEPIGFFMGGVAQLLSYAWFLKTQREFTYEAMHDRVMSNYEKNAFARSGFDISRFNYLRGDVQRLSETLAAQQALSSSPAATAAEVAPEEKKSK